jgi:hypothetical protein
MAQHTKNQTGPRVERDQRKAVERDLAELQALGCPLRVEHVFPPKARCRLDPSESLAGLSMAADDLTGEWDDYNRGQGAAPLLGRRAAASLRLKAYEAEGPDTGRMQPAPELAPDRQRISGGFDVPRIAVEFRRWETIAQLDGRLDDPRLRALAEAYRPSLELLEQWPARRMR